MQTIVPCARNRFSFSNVESRQRIWRSKNELLWCLSRRTRIFQSCWRQISLFFVCPATAKLRQAMKMDNREVSTVQGSCCLYTGMILDELICNRTCSPFLILGSGGGWRLPRRDTQMEYTIISSLPHVVCLSMSRSLRCVQNHYNRPTLVSRKKTCVSIWLLVRSSEAGVLFHYALMPLKTDTRQKISGDRSYTHVPTW